LKSQNSTAEYLVASCKSCIIDQQFSGGLD
jgi:hypothetical protein